MLEEVVLNITKNGDDLSLNHNEFPAIIVITCVLTVFSLVGTTGNAFVLYVFSRKKDKSTSTVFILALAGTDFFTCLFVMPFTIVVEMMYKKVNYDIICKIYQFLITSNVPFSAFIMVAIAFDRYFCICRPWMKFLSIKFAKRIIASLFLFAITLGLITCLAYGVSHYREVIIVDTNSSRATNGTNDLDISTTFSDSNIAGITTQEPLSAGRNLTGSTFKLVYTGFCFPDEVILGTNFRKVYQKFYASLFLISFITVFILYALIYKSILTRRSKRLRASVTHRHINGRRSTMLTSVMSRATGTFQDKSTMAPERVNNSSLHPRTNTKNTDVELHSISQPKGENNANNAQENTGKTEQREAEQTTPDAIDENATNYKPKPIRNCRHKNGAQKHKKNNLKMREKVQIKQTQSSTVPLVIEQGTGNANCEPEVNEMTTITIYRKDTRKSVREKNRLANIKTAGILFIVTLVFIVAFLPAWLMATRLIPANIIVFYMYFSYNVANPVIYAFFNHSFQAEVKDTLNCHSTSVF